MKLMTARHENHDEVSDWTVLGVMESLTSLLYQLHLPVERSAGEDALGQFLADETVSEPGALVSSSDLHKRSQEWWQRQGFTPWTVHTLVKELKARGIQDHRTSTGRGFIGLQLTERPPQ